MTMPRAVELIRVSTDRQAKENTPEMQRRGLDEWRKKEPCVLVERIEALGISGALGVSDRADLQRLEHLAKTRAFDQLRVYRVDRLTRHEDEREWVEIWGMVKDSGAVIAVSGGKVFDPKQGLVAFLMFIIEASGGSEERKKFLQRAADGRRRKAQDGMLSQGLPPYGRRYDRATSQWVEVPAQMEVTRRIIRDVLDGRSSRDVLAALLAEGVPPPKTHWGKSTVLKLMTSAHLLGRYRVMGMTTQIPPVCDEATATAVRAALHRRKSSVGAPPSIPAMLRGMLWCPCGHRAHVLSDGVGTIPRYRCPSGDSRSIHVPEADSQVRGHLLATLLSKPLLEAAAGLGRDETEQRASDQPEDFDAQEARIRGQESRVLRLLDDGLLSEAVARERLASIRAASDAIAAKRVAAQERVTVAAGGDVGATADRWAKNLVRATWREWRELLGVLAVRVVVEPDSLTLTARLPLLDETGMSRAADLAKACSCSALVCVPISLVIAA